MKKITLILTSLLIGSMMMIGCSKKDSAANDDNGGGTVTPPVTEFRVSYTIDTTSGWYTYAHCFKYNFTYYTSATDSVTLTNVTLPWSSEEFVVTKPFNALIKGRITYNEEELPDHPFTMGHCIYIRPGYSLDRPNNFTSKEQFIEKVTTHPTVLDFRFSHTFSN